MHLGVKTLSFREGVGSISRELRGVLKEYKHMRLEVGIKCMWSYSTQLQLHENYSEDIKNIFSNSRTNKQVSAFQLRN